MSKQIALFACQGQVFLNQAKQDVYKSSDIIIKMTNSRNKLTDSDYPGEDVGSLPDAGWYTLTIVDFGTESAARPGDEIEFAVFDAKDHSKKIYDLGKKVVTDSDIDLGGMVVHFDLNGREKYV